MGWDEPGVPFDLLAPFQTSVGVASKLLKRMQEEKQDGPNDGEDSRHLQTLVADRKRIEMLQIGLHGVILNALQLQLIAQGRPVITRLSSNPPPIYICKKLCVQYLISNSVIFVFLSESPTKKTIREFLRYETYLYNFEIDTNTTVILIYCLIFAHVIEQGGSLPTWRQQVDASIRRSPSRIVC